MSNAMNAMLQSLLHASGLSPKVEPPTSQNGVVLSELSHLGYLVLRGKADDAAFMQTVAGVLGQPLRIERAELDIKGRGGG